VGRIFHRKLYSVTSIVFRQNFDLQLITACMHLCTKFELCSCICSMHIKGIRKWWPCARPLTFFELKINRLGQSVEEYYCSKFQVIPIRVFFIVLTYPQTNIMTKPSQYMRHHTTASMLTDRFIIKQFCTQLNNMRQYAVKQCQKSNHYSQQSINHDHPNLSTLHTYINWKSAQRDANTARWL